VLGLTSQASSTVGGIVGRLDLAAGTLDTSTNVSRNANANAFRGAYTTNGTDIWIAGSSNGIRYTTFGTSGQAATSGVTVNGNYRRVYAYKDNNNNTQLYVSSGSTTGGSITGVGRVGSPPPPTTGAVTPTLLSGMPTTSNAEQPYDFWFADSQTLYMAEDTVTSGVGSSGIGLQKWISGDGGATWSEAWNHGMTSSTALGGSQGIKSLGGYRDANGNDIMFAATTGVGANYLVGIIEPAGDTNGSLVVDNVLANSGADFGGTVGDYSFRGVAVAPAVPEPGSLALVAAVGLGSLVLRRPGRGRKRTISLLVIQ